MTLDFRLSAALRKICAVQTWHLKLIQQRLGIGPHGLYRVTKPSGTAQFLKVPATLSVKA